MPVSFITLIIGTIWHNSSDLLIYVKRNPGSVSGRRERVYTGLVALFLSRRENER